MDELIPHVHAVFRRKETDIQQLVQAPVDRQINLKLNLGNRIEKSNTNPLI